MGNLFFCADGANAPTTKAVGSYGWLAVMLRRLKPSVPMAGWLSCSDD
jgi:disulfide oxidoreductase YuzD